MIKKTILSICALALLFIGAGTAEKDKYYNYYNAANGHVEQTGMALSDKLFDYQQTNGSLI